MSSDLANAVTVWTGEGDCVFVRMLDLMWKVLSRVRSGECFVSTFDREAVDRMWSGLMECALAHYRTRPVSVFTPCEVLNAAAILVATIVHAASKSGDDELSIRFQELFDDMLRRQLDGLRGAR